MVLTYTCGLFYLIAASIAIPMSFPTNQAKMNEAFQDILRRNDDCKNMLPYATCAGLRYLCTDETVGNDIFSMCCQTCSGNKRASLKMKELYRSTDTCTTDTLPGATCHGLKSLCDDPDVGAEVVSMCCQTCSTNLS